jgi:methionyl-tRNA synthetase
MPQPALVTCALPYANGHLHIGHLVGYIQADIWVRAQRMQGREVHFVCADDAHGTPIMLAAEKAGQAPEDFIRAIQASHERDFVEFGVAFDHYHSTHSDENRELATRIYLALRGRGAIATRGIEQLFDPERGMFLPDRYVKGECPKCGAADQYGDNCEVCGAAYAPTDLKNPRSAVSGAVPELRQSEHYFFELPKFEAFLRDWLSGEVAHPAVKAKLMEWLDGGLRDWDISRDAPYFGFPIPDAPGKFFYVWLDAPVGYLASFKAYCAGKGLDFEAMVGEGSGIAMHHFIGKDIINFHGLFWPAMLHGAKLNTPTRLHVNGYLTVNGAKMSKSRGTFVQARTWLDHLPAEPLRYYFAAKTGAGVDDLDLNLEDFVQRVNSDLVGKFVNLASRCAKLLETHFEGRLGRAFWAGAGEPNEVERAGIECLATVAATLADVPARYEAGEYSKAIAQIMQAADRGNEYIAAAAPWAVAKDPARRAELEVILTTGINAFAAIARALKPVLPELVSHAERYLNLEGGFDDFRFDAWLSDHRLNPFAPLMTRVDPKAVQSVVDASTESLQPAPAGSAVGAASAATGAKAEANSAVAAKAAPTKAAPTKAAPTRAAPTKSPEPASANSESRIPNPGFVDISDFAKLDLRIGTVLSCSFVEGSDKLLRFELDAGELGRRQIFSGIRASYGEPDKLVGRQVVFIANLAPRKMRFGVSEGMILSAGGDEGLYLLDVDAGGRAGMPVK